MAINKNMKFDSQLENSPLNKYGMNILNTPFIFDEGVSLGLGERYLIVEKLIEAHEVARANVLAGNITGRGFATNVCTNDFYWSVGTNFNNTRNDISSVCGERSAILSSYNEALLRFSKNTKRKFDFKIKYLCMASNVELDEVKETITPCEDCLSWLNTNRYFNFNTLVFGFEKDENNSLVVRASRLVNFLPYKTFKTSLDFSTDKEVKLSNCANNSIRKFNTSIEELKNLLTNTKEAYDVNKFSKISNQNIACSIIANNKTYTSSKLDWTKRWHVEPLQNCAMKAIEEFQYKTSISAIAYFGDEFSRNENELYNDGLVSIKSLGRVRQKYANSDTLIVLNFDGYILITTIGEYLPKKFVQGYKII